MFVLGMRLKNGKKVKLDMADKIQNAYESSKNIYDDVLTQGNIFSKLYIKLFWNGTNDNDIAQKVLSYIPNDFSGNLLDVPVGTAVFTQHKWIALKDAHILVLIIVWICLNKLRKDLMGIRILNVFRGMYPI